MTPYFKTQLAFSIFYTQSTPIDGIESQKREGIIIGNILNQWNAFGKCITVKIG